MEQQDIARGGRRGRRDETVTGQKKGRWIGPGPNPGNRRSADYRRYRLSPREWLLYGAWGLAVCGLTAYTFYRSMTMFLILLPAGLLYPVYKKMDLKRERTRQLGLQFKEAILVLASFLGAGYSLENGLAMSVTELEGLYGKEGMITREFTILSAGVRMNRQPEQLLMEFGSRSGLEDVDNFAQVFEAARRNGGELRFILISGDGGLLLAIAAMDLAFWLVGGRKKGRNEQMREIQPVQEAVKPRRQKDEADEGMWRILYEDESDPLSGTDQRTSGEDETMNACSGKQPVEYSNTFPGHDNEETMRTTLLTGRRTEDELRRLTSIEGEEDEIVISYYPFVIGKNKNLADYVLQKDTVSRFHLRIDKDGGTYTVTDLNSTNGTRVRGKLLDANETAVIEVGDEIIIADIGYIFT